MVMDIQLREGFNEAGKQKSFVYRVHESEVSAFLQEAQKKGHWIIGVNLLHPVKNEKEKFFDKVRPVNSIGDLIEEEDMHDFAGGIVNDSH